MAQTSGIEWTDATWNPVVGCTHVSPGCDNCYAAGLASGRLAGTPTYAGLAEGGRFNGTVRLLPDRLGQPLRWHRPRRVFVNSMSDVFHEAVPDEFIAEMFAVMAAAHRHTFQILTKRHGRMRALLNEPEFREMVKAEAATLAHEGVDVLTGNPWEVWPLRNVWLGVSVEDQRWADIRVPALLDTAAAVRFLSCEPLLGAVRLDVPPFWCLGHGRPGSECPNDLHLNRQGIDWVIAGGESGRAARPMHPDWVRTLRDQCAEAGVAFFFKQWGEYAPINGQEPVRVGKRFAGRKLDGRTHDEYPAAVTP